MSITDEPSTSKLGKNWGDKKASKLAIYKS